MIFICAAGELLFVFPAGFPPLSGFGTQTLSQLDGQGSRGSWSADPCSPGCDSAITPSTPPLCALQGDTFCSRAALASLTSQAKMVYFILRFYLLKGYSFFVLNSSKSTINPGTDGGEKCLETPGKPVQHFAVSPLESSELQPLGPGYVSRTECVWPQVSCLASPSCLLETCVVRQMPVVMERNSWCLKKEYGSEKWWFLFILSIFIYVPSWELLPSEIHRWDTTVWRIWGGVTGAALCHLPCFWTALYLLYQGRNALLESEGSRINWGKVQSTETRGCRPHLSIHRAATDKEDVATQILNILPFFPHL